LDGLYNVHRIIRGGRIIFTLQKPYLTTWFSGKLFFILWNITVYAGFILMVVYAPPVTYNLWYGLNLVLICIGYLICAKYMYKRISTGTESAGIVIILKRTTRAAVVAGAGGGLLILANTVMNFVQLSSPGITSLTRNAIYFIGEIFALVLVLWFIHPRANFFKNKMPEANQIN